MRQGSGDINARAKVLRGRMSPPEIQLWQMLRHRPSGLKFRRQHPAGPYVADFYCHDARLIVEIDGEAHDRGDRPRRDADRDCWFAARGLHTVRIAVRDLVQDPEAVVRGIVATAAARRIHRED